MTGANGGAASSAEPELRWDVALSFAGAQRDYVKQVANALKAQGVRCFYDADEQIELWGRFLAEELPAIYGEQAAAVVMFVSAEYAAREWTRVERRTALARAVRERREYVLPARFDDTQLPGLPSDMVTVDLRTRTPQQFAVMIADKLAALAAASADAGGPARPTRPAGAVRVSEADPRRLGVHAAISVPGVPGEALPEYVPRDVDAVGSGVRAMMTATAEQGGFVLLVGGSSVGKTRSAVEAVKAVLPDWWLVHPAGPAEVAALAAAPPSRTVIWLDELQRYLEGEHALTGGVVRTLLDAPHPAVIIGTMWPNFYEAYTAMPTPGGADPHSREREVLDLAVIVRIGAAFSPAEQDRARAAATRDPRLRVALEAAGYGLTQTLAAAPQLVARWEDAQAASPYAWAVLTAALDAARLGARAPLSPEFLLATAQGYCTSQQQAEAPENWFEQAVAYATAKLHGAAAALSPVGTGMGQIAGYTVADYLIQHASRERFHARVPASTWDAALGHVRDPADAARLADSARNRLLYRYAIPLYRHAGGAGDGDAAWNLAVMLDKRGDQYGAEQALRISADAGDGRAVWELFGLLAERGDLEGVVQVMRARIDAGNGDPIELSIDSPAAERLARLLAEQGDLDRLRALADGRHWEAAKRLAGLLAERGDLDELRAWANAGDGYAAWQLANLLDSRGDRDGAIQVLRPHADHWFAAEGLAFLLYLRGDLDGLRDRADAGDRWAAERLADLLDSRGDRDGAIQVLRARADAGAEYAIEQLAELLARHGDLDGLRAWADTGDGYAAWRAAERLAGLLADRGDLDGLRDRADAGDRYAAERLAGLLADRGDLDGLRDRADAGDSPAAERLAGLLADRGDLDGLRDRTDAGDRYAAERLAGLLADRGDLDELRERADAGDSPAAERLAGLLADRGDLDGLRDRTDAGDRYAAERLAGLLADQLIKQGHAEEAERLRRFGLNPDGSIASA